MLELPNRSILTHDRHWQSLKWHADQHFPAERKKRTAQQNSSTCPSAGNSQNRSNFILRHLGEARSRISTELFSASQARTCMRSRLGLFASGRWSHIDQQVGAATNTRSLDILA
jgi:hypothetical protein